MESVYLKQLVNITPQGGSSDINAPLSFLEWKERLPSVVEKDGVYHYNSYVIEWFNKNKQKTVSQTFLLRQKYLYLLDQLQLFFSEEEKNVWYSQVNLSDEKELLLAIPYFAKKLKDVALYYLKLRKQLKNAKLKYNVVGTATGIEQEIYRYLLESFSTANNELSSALYTTVPAFSTLQTSLVVQVEELYDDKQYFDLSPTVPLTEYFNLLHAPTSEFLATKGVILSSSEWLFESFNIPMSTNFDSAFSQLTGAIFEQSDAALYTSIVNKYIAENKYSTTFASQLSTTTITDVNIAVGNNYFYYPYGTTDNSVSISQQIQKIALSSINIGAPSAGTSLENSDTIFVKNGSEVKSAWLRYKEFEEYPLTVKAILAKDSTTTFIYPFPGYGLSGQDLPWTGAGFETTAEYNFLTKPLKAQVNQAYWSQTLPSDTCDTLLLNNATMVLSGATSDINPQFADRVFVRLDRNAGTVNPYGELSGAWLYEFKTTCIPIAFGHDNVFVWPYGVLDTAQDYPAYYKNLSFSGTCAPVNIQNIQRSSFVAASSIEFADKIYKLNNIADDAAQALECVWLSGSTVNNGKYLYVNQDGFTSLFSAGEAARFVWTGPTSTLNSVFAAIEHRGDCPFVTNNPSVSAFEWQKCACKQVYHTPFGHPYDLFESGNGFADCIAKVTEDNLNPFDIGSWKDSTGSSAYNSLEFAWYKTNSKHSWGDGNWVSNLSASAPFVLEHGKAYFYKRANSRTDSNNMPSYAVNFGFNTSTSRTKWIESKLNSDNVWVSNDLESSMILYPGDLVKCDRQAQTKSYLLSGYEIENVSQNLGSVWSVYDKIPVVCGKSNSTTISWPLQPAPFGSTDSQYPSTSFVDLTSIDAWKITRLEDNQSQTILNTSVITFVPPTTGTYSISVTATKAGGTQIFESTIIPKISAIDSHQMSFIELGFDTPTSGFLIEHSLKGWNYSTHSVDLTAYGARPYWAVLDSGKTSTTRYKGIYSWGYQDVYIDEYLPNHNPMMSPLEIAYGTILEYFRKGYSITWNQPIIYKQLVGLTQWCRISSDTTQSSNLSSLYQNKSRPEPIVIATTIPTDIELSNSINGSPVEVFYHSLKSFTWPVSVTTIQEAVAPDVSAVFVPSAPWTNISNRFYPTIANVPVTEEVYSLEDVGGYFLPQNLGASVFLNKDFTPDIKTSELSGSFLSEDTNIHIGGRGRTREDQTSLYDWSENNRWLKESSTTGDLAGSVKKSLTKTLQTFVPYQSNVEETTLGLVTPRSRMTPWGGTNDEQWMDVANEPKGFTGVRNVSAWAASQILKQNEKVVDKWTSDIYGNQYGLYKQLSGVSVAEHNNIPGELWVRTNSQSVDPAYLALSTVFDPYKTTSLYHELTGSGIRSIDCYFDTLFIETSSIALFAKIDYDYETAIIGSVFDDSRTKTLSTNFRFNENWFFSTDKKVVSLYTQLSGNTFYPVLMELDLPTRSYKKIFPNGTANISNLTKTMSGLEISSVSRGTIYYNGIQNTFLITYTGTESDNRMFVADFCVKREDQLNLTKINLYRDLFDHDAVNEPPMVLAPYLSSINVSSSSFSVNISATNNPTSYSLLNYTTEVTAVLSNGYGLFSGSLAKGLHHINYKVSNNVGDSIYCLTLSAS